VNLAWNAAREAAVLRVCTAGGVIADVEAGGQAEYLGLVDIQPDGRSEIVAGGTTVNEAIGIVYVLERDRLVPVRFGDRTELMLASGSDGDGSRSRWTCSDVDGDGIRELLIRERSDLAHWKVTTISVRGSLAKIASETVADRTSAPAPDSTPPGC
jgi:hypothetical protein